MTITTHNTNPKNDSQWARHRSITKDNQNVLQNTIAALKNQNGSSYRGFDGAPKELRKQWRAKFDVTDPSGRPVLSSLPMFDTSRFKGTAGLAEWLGSASPFLTDLKTIWEDFFKVFVRRADDNNRTKQVLFVCYTATHFDLIYSKWGLTSGHKFFYWQSVVNVRPGRGSRQGLDDSFTDADDFGDENDM